MAGTGVSVPRNGEGSTPAPAATATPPIMNPPSATASPKRTGRPHREGACAGLPSRTTPATDSPRALRKAATASSSRAAASSAGPGAVSVASAERRAAASGGSAGAAAGPECSPRSKRSVASSVGHPWCSSAITFLPASAEVFASH